MVQQIEIIDHSENSLAKFLSQYGEATSFIGFVDAFVSEINYLETDCNDFNTLLPLSGATGVNLDKWGEILNTTIRPSNDENFRVILYGFVGAYYSEGRPFDIRSIVTSLVSFDSLFINDYRNGNFSFTIFSPVFSFTPDLLVDVINLSKPAAIGFYGFTITVRSGDPVFSFASDTRPDSAGFALVNITPASYYDDYVFAPLATISDGARFQVSSITTLGLTDYSLTIFLDTTNGPLFETALAAQMAIAGGLIEFKDGADIPVKIVSDGTVGVSGSTVSTSYLVVLTFETASVPNCEIFFANALVSSAYLLTNFTAYTDADEALWDTNNPSGIVETTITELDVQTRSYYSSFVFPANYISSGYSRVLSSNRSGFPLRYELNVVTNLGAEADAFEAELISSGVGFAVTDASGVLWQYEGSILYGRADIGFPSAEAVDFSIYITADDGSGDPLGSIYKDGISVEYSDFYNDFVTIDKTDEISFNANNPDGLGNLVVATTAIGGGYYSLIIS